MHHQNRINVFSLQIPLTMHTSVYPFAQVSCCRSVCVFVFVNVATNLDQITNVTNKIQSVQEECRQEEMNRKFRRRITFKIIGLKFWIDRLS